MESPPQISELRNNPENFHHSNAYRCNKKVIVWCVHLYGC